MGTSSNSLRLWKRYALGLIILTSMYSMIRWRLLHTIRLTSHRFRMIMLSSNTSGFVLEGNGNAHSVHLFWMGGSLTRMISSRIECCMYIADIDLRYHHFYHQHLHHYGRLMLFLYIVNDLFDGNVEIRYPRAHDAYIELGIPASIYNEPWESGNENVNI